MSRTLLLRFVWLVKHHMIEKVRLFSLSRSFVVVVYFTFLCRPSHSYRFVEVLVECLDKRCFFFLSLFILLLLWITRQHATLRPTDNNISTGSSTFFPNKLMLQHSIETRQNGTDKVDNERMFLNCLETNEKWFLCHFFFCF